MLKNSIKSFFFLMMATSQLSLFADNPPEYQRPKGGYMGFTMNYSEIDKQNGFVIGGRGGVYLTDKIIVGLGGYAILNQYSTKPEISDPTINSYNTEGGYFGGIGEYNFSVNSNLSINIPVFLGFGGVYMNRDFNNLLAQWETEVIDEDMFGISLVGLEMELLKNKYMRVNLGIYYRYTFGVELKGEDFSKNKVTVLNSKDLNGFELGITFKLGQFVQNNKF